MNRNKHLAAASSAVRPIDLPAGSHSSTDLATSHPPCGANPPDCTPLYAGGRAVFPRPSDKMQGTRSFPLQSDLSPDSVSFSGSRSRQWREINMAVLWDVPPCSLVQTDRRFRGANCLPHHGNQILVNLEVSWWCETVRT
jgi:hypothetical protein